MIRAIPLRPHPTKAAGGGRRLSVAALCLSIALSMHAHRDDGSGIEAPAGSAQEAKVQTRPSEPDYFNVVRDASNK